jgi:hypothetical protein
MTARNEQQVNHNSNEDQQLVGTSAGSCTFNHIPRDDPALLLTVAAHEHGSNQVPINTQYDSQKEIGVLAPAHTEYGLQGIQEDEQWLSDNSEGVIVTKTTNNDVLIQTLPFLTVSTAHNCKQTMESETHFVGGGGNITGAFLGTGMSLQTVSKLFLTKQ